MQHKINLSQLKKISSYFDIEELNGKGFLSTRDNGSVGDEEYSDIDYEVAESIVSKLKKDFGIIAEIDTCDEWVHISFTNLDQREINKLRDIKTEIKKTDIVMQKFFTTVFEKIKSQKSLKKTCKNCDSNIAIAHLRTVACPVCSTNMLSNTEQTKLDKISAKFKKLIEEEKSYN